MTGCAECGAVMLASCPIHHVKQRSLLRSRHALLRPGSFLSFASVPNRGAGGAPTGAVFLLSRLTRATDHAFSCACPYRKSGYHFSGTGAGEARRASSGTRSPLGAPPWRFWVGGRASFSGISSGSVERAPRSRVVVPGGRGPGPPEPAGYEPAAAGRHSPLRLQDRLRRRPS